MPYSQTDELTEIDIKKPKKYRVIMHNDHYSTWEFVVDTLKRVFYKSEAQAVEITNHVHNEGRGICGLYTKEIAEMKIDQVHSLAKANNFPLRCSMEEEDAQ